MLSVLVRVAAALLAFYIASPVQAQNAGTVSSHAVAVGKGPGVAGLGSVAPGTSGRPLVSNGASSDPSFQTLPNSGLATGAPNTVKGSLDGATTSDLALASCSALYNFTQWISGTGWQCGIDPVLPSRATAATLDLSALSAVTTQGYSTAGDGGGATFKNVGASPFIDSLITGGSIQTAGSGCTNGTYYGVSPTGGTGVKLQGIVVVSGGVMTSFTPTGTKGNGYTVNDVLTIPNGDVSCSAQPTWKVTAVTTPVASFSDSAGNHWQYMVSAGNFPNVRQFGAKLDRAGKANDGLATNDQAAIQNAIGFAAYGLGSSDAGGNAGNKVIVPAGTSLICGGLMVPTSVRLVGAGQSSTTLKECDTEAATQNFITLGDPLNHKTAFFAGLDDMTLFGANAGVTGTVAMVYTDSAQGTLLNNVSIYPIYRGIVFAEIGYGGPNMQHLHGVYGVPNSGVTPFGIAMHGAAIIKIDGYSWFSSGGFWNNPAILINDFGPGLYEIDDFYCENMAICVSVNIPAGGNNPMVHVNGISGSASTGNVISRTSGSTTGQLVVEFATPLGGSCTVSNNGSCVATGEVIARTTY